MKLIREQMASLIRDLGGLQAGFDDVRMKQETDAIQSQSMHEELHRDKEEMQTELMALIAALQADSNGHSSRLDEVAQFVGDGMAEDRMFNNHAALERNLAELQRAHGDFSQKHSRELASLKDSHNAFAGNFSKNESANATVQDRLAYLENALGDSANQHTGKLEAAMAKLDQLLSRVSAVEAQGNALGKAHGEKHASMQERMSYLEGLIGDSADKHAKELDALKVAHDRTAGALSKHSKFMDDQRGVVGKHESLQERVDEIEQALGIHADRHGEGLAQHASRMEQLHSRLAAVERFGAVLEELKRSNGSLSKDKQDLFGKHSALLDRLDAMDRSFGETFDKHGKNFQALSSAHDKHQGAMSKHMKELEALRAERAAHHDRLVDRLENFEQQNGDSHDRHAANASQLHSKYQALMDRFGAVDKYGNQIGNLQKSHDALAARKAELESGHASMGERVGYLEKMLGDSVEKHAKELRDLKDSHSKHKSDLDGLRGLHVKHATVDQRLDYIEKCIGDSADKQSEELAELKRAHAGLHGRLSSCEGFGSTLAELRKSHDGLLAQRTQLGTHHASLKERVDYLEGILNDSADKHKDSIDAAHAKITDVTGRLVAVERFGTAVQELKRSHSELFGKGNSLESDHGSFKERLENIESMFGDVSNRHTKELKGMKGLLDKHASFHTKYGSQLDALDKHREQHASIPERIAYIEQTIGDSADKHTADLAELHNKLAKEAAAREKHHGSIKDLIARDKDARDGHHASLNERVDYLEGAMGDNADKHAKQLELLSSGHQKLTSELKAKGDGGFIDRVSKLEKVVTECSEKQSRDARVLNSKFECFHTRLSVVKDAWGQDTPRV